MSACADPDDTWQSSPAVMDYLKCSDSNKDYFERLWAVEEARAYAKSLDYMDDDVKAIKREEHFALIVLIDRDIDLTKFCSGHVQPQGV